MKLDIRNGGAGQLLYGTYLGGSGQDRATGVAVDASGLVYVRGETRSTNFPVTADAIQSKSAGGWDGFLTLVSPGTPGWIHSTYLGGSADDLSTAKPVLNGQGGIYLAGFTMSTDYPVSTGALQTSNKGLWDGFVSKIEFPTPFISAAGVGSAASYATGKVSPGEIIVIYGRDLGPPSLVGPLIDPAGFLSNNLSDTRVYFDGVPATMIYTRSDVLSAVVPYAVAGRASTQLQVQYKSTLSNLATLPVAVTVPALFTLNQSGQGPGAILNQDYSINTNVNPIGRGQIAMIYGTGEGETVPTGVDGKLGTVPLPAPKLLSDVHVRIGGIEAPVKYLGGAQGLVAGLFQLNVQIPDSVTPGQAEVIVTMGGASSQSGVTIAVR